MSTITEIENAVEELSRREQELLYAHLGARLEASSTPAKARLDALEALQSRLALDAEGSHQWQAAVQAARR